MQSKDLLKAGLETTMSLVFPMLEDLKDATLTMPTSAGGNHAWWLAGHLTFSEGHILWEAMRGETNPNAEWKELFAGGTQPHPEGAGYPLYEEILSKYQQLRSQTYSLIDSLSEEDLDQSSVNVPRRTTSLLRHLPSMLPGHHLARHDAPRPTRRCTPCIGKRSDDGMTRKPLTIEHRSCRSYFIQ